MESNTHQSSRTAQRIDGSAQRDENTFSGAPHSSTVFPSASPAGALSAEDALDVRVTEARNYIARASALLRGLGNDYERVSWVLEDTLGMLDPSEFESEVDYDAEFEILTREFVPMAALRAEDLSLDEDCKDDKRATSESVDPDLATGVAKK